MCDIADSGPMFTSQMKSLISNVSHTDKGTLLFQISVFPEVTDAWGWIIFRSSIDQKRHKSYIQHGYEFHFHVCSFSGDVRVPPDHFLTGICICICICSHPSR